MGNEGEIIITLQSTEKKYSYESLGVTYESTDEEIQSSVRSVLLEEEGVDIEEKYEDGYFTIKRVEDSKNIYFFPKSTTGVFSSLKIEVA